MIKIQLKSKTAISLIAISLVCIFLSQNASALSEAADHGTPTAKANISSNEVILTDAEFFSVVAPAEPDFSENAQIPPGQNRANIFLLSDEELRRAKRAGYGHASKYPVTVTGLVVPYRPLLNFLKADFDNPIKKLLAKLGHAYVGFKTEQDIYKWLGLNPYNSPEKSVGIFDIPRPTGKVDQFPVGAHLVDTKLGPALSFSCFTCHSSSFFGKTVMGLTNKRTRANEFFLLGKQAISVMPAGLFQFSTDATDKERLQYERTQNNIKRVGVVKPQVLGLDTSLPQVALSLSHRADDPYATEDLWRQQFPEDNPLEHTVADSKPLPWWNVKYKTRWLADGSIVAGNPVLTNFLWNELGRGTDLYELEIWMRRNADTIRDLTAAVFATEAPTWTDFFPESKIDLNKAMRGESLYKESCAKCHGEYVKAWSNQNSALLSKSELIKTVQVLYLKETRPKDVGTDPMRAEGMKYFAERLNNLAISKWMKTVVVPQKGYVAPPLVGVFARYPYFHNNSIPNLCALMTPPQKRPQFFVQGPSQDQSTDFDFDCVGYPVGEKIPKAWLQDEAAFFDTRKEGLSNSGHYKMFLKEVSPGVYQEKYSEEQKQELREYLKTL